MSNYDAKLINNTALGIIQNLKVFGINLLFPHKFPTRLVSFNKKMTGVISLTDTWN